MSNSYSLFPSNKVISANWQVITITSSRTATPSADGIRYVYRCNSVSKKANASNKPMQFSKSPIANPKCFDNDFGPRIGQALLSIEAIAHEPSNRMQHMTIHFFTGFHHPNGAPAAMNNVNPSITLHNQGINSDALRSAPRAGYGHR